MTMKKILFILAVILLFFSCEKSTPLKINFENDIAAPRGGNGNGHGKTFRLAPNAGRGIYYDDLDTYPHVFSLDVSFLDDTSSALIVSSTRLLPNPDNSPTGVKTFFFFKQVTVNNILLTNFIWHYGSWPCEEIPFPQVDTIYNANMICDSASCNPYNQVYFKINGTDCHDNLTGSRIAGVVFQ